MSDRIQITMPVHRPPDAKIKGYNPDPEQVEKIVALLQRLQEIRQAEELARELPIRELAGMPLAP